VPAKQAASDLKATRDIKVISSAGARALADACTAWAEQNKKIVAMAILDWGGNLIESHAMEGAPMNAIDTALLKAKSDLRWRRPTSETNKMVRSGENLAPTFMHDFPQPGALPIMVNGQVIGAMGVSSADGEKCAQAAIDAVFNDKQPLRYGNSGAIVGVARRTSRLFWPLFFLGRESFADSTSFKKEVSQGGSSFYGERSPSAQRSGGSSRTHRHNNDQGGRRLWIQSDATYLQPAPRRRPWPQASPVCSADCARRSCYVLLRKRPRSHPL